MVIDVSEPRKGSGDFLCFISSCIVMLCNNPKNALMEVVRLIRSYRRI